MEYSEQFSENKAEVGGQDNPYWADKGAPKEQFDITFGERKIEVVNFSEIALTGDQLGSLQKIIAEFSQIENGEVFNKVRSIFIDNEQPVDSELKDGLNGMGVENCDGIVKLYPRALKPIPHRVKGVSNFEGTVIHEFAHALFIEEKGKDIEKEWNQKFGWNVSLEKLDKLHATGIMEELKATPRKEWNSLHPHIWKLIRVWDIDEPGKCVTDYAKLGPEDDLADSMVAALRNPNVLDPQRLRFLKTKFLANIDEKNLPIVDIQKRL